MHKYVFDKCNIDPLSYVFFFIHFYFSLFSRVPADGVAECFSLVVPRDELL